MITGIGIDIVEINRMYKWLDNLNLLERFFHSNEISFLSSRYTLQEKDVNKQQYAQALAARFAAKEAFGKALGTGLSGISLKDIMVLNNENGKPEIKLFGSALDAFIKSGAAKSHISLSHEKENAIAMIILEAENAG